MWTCQETALSRDGVEKPSTTLSGDEETTLRTACIRRCYETTLRNMRGKKTIKTKSINNNKIIRINMTLSGDDVEGIHG